ncbi:CASP-like protein 4A3 [Sesamum indicum]|uniref:CASP-like protein n=1 Tax=Sesamum indicum TaxID=4182 RepID=A0A6I9ULC7_SESIN|nr:CASP-like protein 4A3 [Sesamum indicum]
MEGADPSNHSKRSLRRNSNSHISMSDTESTTSQVDSWHSPLRSESPLRSDDPSFLPENDDSGSKNSRSLVVVDKYYSPVPSPGKSSVPAGSLAAGGKGRRPWPHSEKPTSENLDLPTSFPAEGGKDGRREGIPAEKPVAENLDVPEKGTSPVVVGLNKFVREEQPPDVKKVGPVGGDGRGLEEGYGGGRRENEVGGETRSRAAVASILKRSERDVAVKKVALAFRVFEVIACLISFSVMAADKTQGWSGDSFDRYVEYRYCLAVNVIGFTYSSFQAFDLAYHLGTGKHVFTHHLRYHFDFTMDQILAYLLMSASSSAATRVDDWISNWGGDEFTLMASASIAISFLAFIAFACSSLMSGYNLCNRDST